MVSLGYMKGDDERWWSRIYNEWYLLLLMITSPRHEKWSTLLYSESSKCLVFKKLRLEKRRWLSFTFRNKSSLPHGPNEALGNLVPGQFSKHAPGPSGLNFCFTHCPACCSVHIAKPSTLLWFCICFSLHLDCSTYLKVPILVCLTPS